MEISVATTKPQLGIECRQSRAIQRNVNPTPVGAMKSTKKWKKSPELQLGVECSKKQGDTELLQMEKSC